MGLQYIRAHNLPICSLLVPVLTITFPYHCSFPSRLILLPWRWRQNVLPKHMHRSTRFNRVISPNKVLFMAIDLSTSTVKWRPLTTCTVPDWCITVDRNQEMMVWVIRKERDIVRCKQRLMSLPNHHYIITLPPAVTTETHPTPHNLSSYLHGSKQAPSRRFYL